MYRFSSSLLFSINFVFSGGVCDYEDFRGCVCVWHTHNTSANVCVCLCLTCFFLPINYLFLCVREKKENSVLYRVKNMDTRRVPWSWRFIKVIYGRRRQAGSKGERTLLTVMWSETENWCFWFWLVIWQENEEVIKNMGFVHNLDFGHSFSAALYFRVSKPFQHRTKVCFIRLVLLFRGTILSTCLWEASIPSFSFLFGNFWGAYFI